MIEVTFSRQALRDLISASDRYEVAAGRRVADDFAQDVRSVRTLIAHSVDVGYRTKRAGTRVVMLPRFPYQVFYKRQSSEELRILRIRHAHRRPLSWS